MTIPTYLKTISLCLLGICAATPITFSQVPAPAPQAAETTGKVVVPGENRMPAPREITDTNGRTLKGTITAKTPTEISFTRSSDGKSLTIGLDTLSQDDRAFIDTLIPPKQTTVLLLVDAGTGGYSATVGLLRENGFDVTIGVCPRRNAEEGPRKKPDDTFEKISKREKAILVSTLGTIDPYDILWIEKFGFRSTEKGAASAKSHGGFGIDLRPNHFELTRHHQKTEKLTVIRSRVPPEPDRFLIENTKYPTREGSYYVKPRGKSWVFYYSGKNDGIRTSEEEIHRKLIATVIEQMDK